MKNCVVILCSCLKAEPLETWEWSYLAFILILKLHSTLLLPERTHLVIIIIIRITVIKTRNRRKQLLLFSEWCWGRWQWVLTERESGRNSFKEKLKILQEDAHFYSIHSCTVHSLFLSFSSSLLKSCFCILQW